MELENFCIDGLHFVDDGKGDPENTYLNGKTGIYVASAQDSFRITGMGIIYLEHGVTLYNSDEFYSGMWKLCRTSWSRTGI